MNETTTLVLAECSDCLRECEQEVTHRGVRLRSPVAVWAHGSRCLVCGYEGLQFFGPGEMDEALRSAQFAAA